MPSFEFITGLVSGVIFSILIELLYLRIRTFLLQGSDVDFVTLGTSSLPIIADVMKTIIIWILLLSLRPALDFSLANLILLGMLFSILNNTFWLQMQGSVDAPFRLLALLLLVGTLQCVGSTVIMGMFLS